MYNQKRISGKSTNVSKKEKALHECSTLTIKLQQKLELPIF